MPDLIRGSEGHTFQIGLTHIYAGPRSERKGLPILAVQRPDDKKTRIVATFPNSTSCEVFIQYLMTAIDEATAIPVRAAAPEVTDDEQATVERFGFDTPPTPAEMVERIQLLGAGKVTFVTDDEAVA